MNKRQSGFVPIAILFGVLILSGVVSEILFLAKKTKTSKPIVSVTTPSGNIKVSPRPFLSATPRPTLLITTPPTQTPLPLPSLTTKLDNIAPIITSFGGPTDDSTVEFSNFCFPLYITDNVSKYPNIWIHFRFDTDTWSTWSTDVAPCFNNVENGQHTIAIQAKDQAGNISQELKKTFSVSVLTNGKISGLTFNDVNLNGTQDSGENGIHFLKINLYRQGESAALKGIGSGEDGTFQLTDLSGGTYQVKAVNPTGQYQITTTDSITITLTSTNSEVTGLKFGVVKKW